MITTIENIKELPGMAENIRDKRIIPYLQEVEDASIIPAIGAELYERLDSGELADDTLISGGYYDTKQGRRLCHGIRKAVAYIAYAKMLRANKVSVTAFGVTEKRGNFSQSADETSVNYAANHADKMGTFYLDSSIEYLRSKEDNHCGCEKKSSRIPTMSIIK